MVLSYSVCLKKQKINQEKTIAEKFDQYRTTAISADGVVFQKKKKDLTEHQDRTINRKKMIKM